MLILIIMLSILFISGIFLYKISEISGIILSCLSGIFLLFSLILIPANRYCVNIDIQKFRVTEFTIQRARQDNYGIENAAIQQKIIEMNKWLVSIQYQNVTFFDIYIPDEVMQLELLE